MVNRLKPHLSPDLAGTPVNPSGKTEAAIPFIRARVWKLGLYSADLRVGLGLSLTHRYLAALENPALCAGLFANLGRLGRRSLKLLSLELIFDLSQAGEI